MMERLTNRDKYGYAFAKGDNIDLSVATMYTPSIVRGDVVDRLADYEDTGLEPEEIESLKSGAIPAHWAELFEAECEGRLVVLPCKVGDTLWVHDRDGKLRAMALDAPDVRCHCAKEDNLCMATCDNPENGVCAYRLRNDGSDIGKTVFLTREEAEQALAERK